MAPHISLKYFRYYTTPLVENGLSHFDRSKDGKIQPKDFGEDDELLSEFVGRYAHSPKSVRALYLQPNITSDPMKHRLAYELVLIWQDKDASEEDRALTAEVLSEDFNVEPADTLDEDGLYDQLYQSKFSVGETSDTFYTSDSIRGDTQRLTSFDTTIAFTKPFRFSGNRVLFTPGAEVLGSYLFGERRLHGMDREDIGYLIGAYTGRLLLKDLEGETWGLSGNCMYVHRSHVPDGFSSQNWIWGAAASVEYPADLPFSIFANASGLRNIYSAPVYEDQNHRSEDMATVDSYLSYSFLTYYAMLAGYTYYTHDNVQSYSSESRERHSGYAKFRFQSLGHVLDAVVSGSSEEADVGKRSKGKTEYEHNRRTIMKAGARYLRYLDGTSSLDAALLGRFLMSSGDLDANFGGYEVALSGAVYIVPDIMRMKLNGAMYHDMIYQSGHRYELGYSGEADFDIYPAKRFTITPIFRAAQTVYDGGIDMTNTSLNGELQIKYFIPYYKGVELLGILSYTRAWDSDENFRTDNIWFEAKATFSF
jgi:hypothetical protein